MNQKTRKEQRAKVKFDEMPRGAQVAYLMKPEDKGGEGMDATAVSKALGISRNAVYQQIRKNRLKSGGGAKSTAKKSGGSTAKKSGGSTKKASGGGKATTSRRKSGGSGAKAPAAAAAPAPTPTPVIPEDATPEQVIEARLSAVDSAIQETEAQINSLTVALDGDGDKDPGLRAEAKRLSRALAALKGEPVENGTPLLTPTEGDGKGEAKSAPAKRPGTRARQKREGEKSGGNGSAPAQPAEQPAAGTPAAESTTPPAAAAAPPADDPFEGQGEGAEAEQAQAAAEAPQA